MKSSVTSHVIARTRSARNMNAPFSTQTMCTPLGWSCRDLLRESGDALLQLILGDECLHVYHPTAHTPRGGDRLSGPAGKGNIAPDRETLSDGH